MIIIVKNEAPFQVLTGAFTIGPSPTGYELQVGATPDSFTTLFSVGANTPRMVTNVANGSFYRLKNNVGDVKVNWSRTCIDNQGGGGSTYTAGEYINIDQDIISVTGITPDLYLTTADTQDFATQADITAATSPIQEHLDDVEHVTASALTELHQDILDLSGATPDLSNYYTKQETDTQIADAIADIPQPNMSNYYTKDEIGTKEEVVSRALNDLNTSKVSSTSVSTIVKLTQAEYDAIATPDASTLYIITNS